MYRAEVCCVYCMYCTGAFYIKSLLASCFCMGAVVKFFFQLLLIFTPPFFPLTLAPRLGNAPLFHYLQYFFNLFDITMTMMLNKTHAQYYKINNLGLIKNCEIWQTNKTSLEIFRFCSIMFTIVVLAYNHRS